VPTLWPQCRSAIFLKIADVRACASSGVDETQAIHCALHEFALKVLPQYEADDGPLFSTELRQVRKAWSYEGSARLVDRSATLQNIPWFFEKRET
jgi:hypothetical protein